MRPCRDGRRRHETSPDHSPQGAALLGLHALAAQAPTRALLPGVACSGRWGPGSYFPVSGCAFATIPESAPGDQGGAGSEAHRAALSVRFTPQRLVTPREAAEETK